MIYIKTKYGWYSTGQTDSGQLRIDWNRYALAYALTSYFAGRNDRQIIVSSFSQIIYKYIKD